MSLDSGTKLARYEIRSKIGEGGMGEVYRAFDPKDACQSFHDARREGYVYTIDRSPHDLYRAEGLK